MSAGETNWFVINTYSGYEDKVKANLERRIESMGVADQIFAVLIPTDEVVEIKAGKRITVLRKTYPGYILVEMIMTPESWFAVRNTPGVTGFIGGGGATGGDPLPLSPAEVAKILGAGVKAPVLVVPFVRGDGVIIKDGPFSDMMGTVEDVNGERQKVKVLVSMFGRETPVELDFLQVAKL